MKITALVKMITHLLVFLTEIKCLYCVEVKRKLEGKKVFQKSVVKEEQIPTRGWVHLELTGSLRGLFGPKSSAEQEQVPL